MADAASQSVPSVQTIFHFNFEHILLYGVKDRESDESYRYMHGHGNVPERIMLTIISYLA